ncbi:MULTISPECIES: DUF7519 family protein [Halococcus]|uniref:Uncharacterized protein n=1 Tax=Halococcus salifodinae DSM 8989 TaxID=1227456 RepID=M0MZV5_9EURY|nr:MULTISPECIES: hypothetical protein [Halococcus]EMA51272.1 hypothetical protein C450_12380 [Halococcus salifodinae DSM 8989]
MEASSIVKQPTYAGSVLAVVAAACVTGVLASQPVQVSIAGVGAVGAVLLLGSGLVRRRGHRVLGGGFVFVGCSLVCLALGLSLLSPGGLFERIAFFGGTLAMACVVLGVFPLRQSWAGSLVGFGIVLFSCSLIFLAWISDPGRVQLLLGVGLTIVTWDVAEHAITLGNDVGRSARTYPVTMIHFVGSLGVGLAAGTVTLVVDSVQLPAIPIAALALLLGAVLLLLLVLFLGDSEWLSGT